MPGLDFISAIHKHDINAVRQFYEENFAFLSGIAFRYAKSRAQSREIVQGGFAHVIQSLNKFKHGTEEDFKRFIKDEFIKFCVDFIRNIRSEYYVASTVRVTDAPVKNYDLFADNVLTDFKNVEYDVLILSLQQLVPSQRLIFNLHVVDGYDLRSAADLLEASEQTVKSNLEKARYNLQKNIDKNCKIQKNEQPV